MFAWIGEEFDKRLGDALGNWLPLRNVVIDSAEGGDDQELHKDIALSMFQELKEWPIHSCIVTGEDPAELLIQPPKATKPVIKRIGEFKVFAFHGRLLHAGRGYPKDQGRRHRRMCARIISEH